MRVWLLIAAVSLGAAAVEAAEGLSEYFPYSGEMPGWTATEAMAEYIGDDLFRMIDGGAEIYREYGFVRAGTQEFGDQAGHRVTVEIYEMKDPGAAYGIFTFKARQEGTEVALGNGGRQTDYYLNFWKGRYLATLTGSDASAFVKIALKTLGSAVEKKITDTGTPPAFGSAIAVRIDHHEPAITYIRGPIALSNFYRFGAGDPFAFREGYVAQYAQAAIFVLAYDADSVCQSRFSAARTAFAGDSNFTMDAKNDRTSAERYVMSDRRGHGLECTRTGKYLIIAVGRSDNDARTAIDTMVPALERFGR